MVAGGLNSANADYTAAIADLALEMGDWLRNPTTGTGVLLDLRIGIGTGPVVAGVVGKKKFIYDLWGDTGNLASRITTEGVPGMVQVDTLSPAAQPLRRPRAADALPEGQGRHSGVSADRAQG
jgi:adenylate cyclase